MRTIEHLVENDPSLLVIHIIRDPRAIMVSRSSVVLISYNADKSAEKEGVILCKQMMEDYKARRIMEHKFPKTFLQIRYEDLTTNPHDTLVKFTDHLTIPDREVLEERMHGMLFASNLEKTKSFEQMRSNATATALAWRNKIPTKLKRVMDTNEYCQEVYRTFGYSV